MVHRSLIGSLERLFAYLIEVHAGAFPAWYAPEQVAVLPVGLGQVEAAAGFARAAVEAGLRAQVALRLRDGRTLDPLAAADALRLITDVVAARSAELLP